MAVKSLARSSIRQSSKVNSALTGYESNYFHHLETVRLGGTAAEVIFSNLSRYNDYQHFQIRYVARTDRGGVPFSNGAVRLNGDTGNNYNSHYMFHSGSSVGSGYSGTTSRMLVMAQPGGTFTANAYAAGVLDFLDVFDTAKNTTVRVMAGYTGNDTQMGLYSGLWLNTAAITSITVLNWDGANLTAGSRFSLYGLKART